MIFDRLMEDAIETLPCSTGLNREWDYTLTYESFILRSSYCVFNGEGYCEGYQPFTVEFHFQRRKPFKVTLLEPVMPNSLNYRIKEYLEVVFSKWERKYLYPEKEKNYDIR